MARYTCENFETFSLYPFGANFHETEPYVNTPLT